MDKSDIYWQTYLNLESSLIHLSRQILITDVSQTNINGGVANKNWRDQLCVFSPYIADLLVTCCVQVEAISKELYFAHGGDKERDSAQIFFDEDCIGLVNRKWDAGKKIVNVTSPMFYLVKEENKSLRPLNKAERRKGAYWEKAYQAVKHDRFESMPMGNVKALIQAMAALYLLNIYYRNEAWLTSINNVKNFDYSMGSAIFSIMPPTTDMLWYGNKPNLSSSPFVASYTSSGYSEIKRIQDREEMAVKDYLSRQPEIKEQAFVKRLREAELRGEKVMTIVELSIYRINKNIPPSLPFEERKSRLLNSKEWEYRAGKERGDLDSDKLTSDNIQMEIDNCGRYFGYRLLLSIQKMEWLPIATEKKICEIYIPD